MNNSANSAEAMTMKLPQTLASLIQTANLTSGLSGNTVLAPRDSAFQKLPPALLSFLVDESNRDTLRKILLYHVIPSNSNLSGQAYPSVIEIDQVLIPPDLTEAVNQVVESSTPSPVTPSNTGSGNQLFPVRTGLSALTPPNPQQSPGVNYLPKWIYPHRPNNNFA